MANQNANDNDTNVINADNNGRITASSRICNDCQELSQ